MDLAAAGLNQQPFRTHGKPLVTVAYRGYRDAMTALRSTAMHDNGLTLLQGPALSGKRTLVREFVDSLDAECAVARVDGKGLNTTALLETILKQFGYQLDYNSANELFAMLRVFAMQQAARHEPPLIVVEDIHGLNPSALRALCELAELKIRRRSATQASALKMILVSDRSLQPLMDAPALATLADRVTEDCHMHPMNAAETTNYLHAKLQAAGSAVPDFVFPASICAEVWQASGGWPGIVDRIALLALSRAATLPVSSPDIEHPTIPQGTWDGTVSNGVYFGRGRRGDPPRLVVSLQGRVVSELNFEAPRLLIGRSEHNDIAVTSRFVSRHHALLVRSANTTFLMDLNSTNGTLVNSRRVSNHVLLHEDVISIGDHRIKFYDPQATAHVDLGGDEFAETAIMKSLSDMRSLLAQENTALLPAASEELPTVTNQP